ncbi:MAG: rod shape-determining protein RodA [Frankiaceae bacterium]|nr:rod shape-determining protein RodA [Frankiaceae bacterium]MBV9870790.1 rod shape-determining protein RodA [Frankiaceae bacterium]
MSEWSETARSSPIPRRRPESLASRALDREGFLRQLDWVLLGAVAVLCVMGLALVWAATKPQGLGPSYLKKDALNVIIGVMLAVLAASVDYRTLRAYTPVLYGASVLGLITVLSPLGQTVNGAHSWIGLGGGFEIQPAEFAKVAVVLGLAMLLSEKREGTSEPTRQDILLCFAFSAIPIILILLQPDVGSIMVFGIVVFGMLALSGIEGRWIVGMLLVALLAFFLIAHLHLLHQYQIDRFTAFTHPNATDKTAQTINYNPQQAQIAIGHGGLFGQGLGNGTQTNGQFVPEQQTDFVFSVAGEELGMVGAGLLVLLSGLVLYRALRIARLAEDRFGMLVAVGIACWFAFQVFENIGMNLGVMPITGLPLPFVSYGGTSMFASMIAIGLLQNVYIRTQR